MAQQTLEEVFDNYLDSKSVFKDKKILSTNYKPDKLPHRQKEINSIASVLSPVLKGYKPSNLFLYGKTGTGKSAVVRYVTHKLRSRANENGKDVKIVYINCKLKKVADTEYRLLAELARRFDEEVPATGLPTDEVYRRFFEALDNKERILVLVLDEIDSLVEKTGDNFLYSLIRTNEDLEKSQISVVGISNNISFKDNLDPRVKSSLSDEEILFKPYNATQLKDILKTRSNQAFNEGSLPDEVISKCSALAAQEHGDARRAIDLLRVSGELAERGNSSQVKTEHVDKAEREIDRNRIIQVVGSQPRQSQAVLWSILKLLEAEDKVQTGDVYSVYEDVCNRCGIKLLTQRRISDLISELDMLGVIRASVTSKGRYGRTRLITSAITDSVEEEVKKMLRDEYYFG